jgi:hypothetical protein
MATATARYVIHRRHRRRGAARRRDDLLVTGVANGCGWLIDCDGVDGRKL